YTTLFRSERHVDRLVVHEEAVLLFAMIAQSFAMIRKQDDGRAVVQLGRLEAFQEAADDLVAVGNLAVVRRVGGKTRGRRIRRVRFVQVQEQKDARRALLVEPPL